MDNCISKKKNNQDILKITDKKITTEKFINFIKNKGLTMERLIECGNFIKFIANKDGTKQKLKTGNFCKNRFCPICSWIKAKKTAFELLELISAIKHYEKKEFIFITLTAPNVTGSELESEIKDFSKSSERFFKSQDIKKINKGYIRKLEVTYNSEMDTYHPHLHLLVAVNKSYFKSRDYLSREKILELWKRSKRDNSITQVDVRKASVGSIKEIMELATYSSKNSDLFYSQSVFDVFYSALRGKQLITFNGLFKDYRKLQNLKKLNLDEIEELKNSKELAVQELYYFWKDNTYELVKVGLISQERFYDLEKLELIKI